MVGGLLDGDSVAVRIDDAELQLERPQDEPRETDSTSGNRGWVSPPSTHQL